MKKIYTTVVALLMAASATMAQSNGQVPTKEWNTSKTADRITLIESARGGGGQFCAIEEGFDSAIPATWDNIMTNANQNWVWDGTTGNPGGNLFIEYDAALGQQDESIITDSIDLSSITNPGLYFDWLMSYFWGVSPNDNYDLTVSITTDNGANWTDLWTEADEGEFDTFEWYTEQIDLSAYASETGAQFRFNYNGSDGAQANFDNIRVCELPANDLVMNTVYAGDNINDYLYSMIPTTQAVEVIAGAVATNFGVATQNNLSYDWEVTLDGSPVASGTQAGAAALAAGGMDTVWISTGYTPTTTGELVVSIEVGADETEEVPADNIGEAAVMYTDYVWAHDYEDEGYFELGYEGSSTDGSGGFEMGADYFCQVDGDMIYAAQFALGSSTTSTSVVVNIYEDDPNNGPIEVTVYDIMPGDLSSGSINFITVVLDNPVPMSAGSVYSATVEISAGEDGFILGNDIDDGDGGQSLYLTNDGSWYNWIGLTTSMRLNLDATIDVEENNTVSGVYMYPNPANDNLNVGFVSKQGEDLTVNILGIDGSLIASEQLATKAGQSSLVSFNIENLSAGMYMVQIQGATSTLTQKVVVQ